MMTAEELATPLTAIEIAELMRAATDTNYTLTERGKDRLRRMAFELDFLRAHIADWQPIDTAPKDDEPVLVWYPKAFRGKGGHYVALWQDGKWWAAVNAFSFEPSHWMPLPKPPDANRT